MSALLHTRSSHRTFAVPAWRPDGSYAPQKYQTGFPGRFRVRIKTAFLRQTGIGLGPVLNLLRNLSEAVSAGDLPAEFSRATVHIHDDPNALYLQGVLNPQSPLHAFIRMIPAERRADTDWIAKGFVFCFRNDDRGNPQLTAPFPILLLPDELQKQLLSRAPTLPAPVFSMLAKPAERSQSRRREKPRVGFMGGVSALDYGQLIIIESIRRKQAAAVRQFRPIEIADAAGGGANANFDANEIMGFNPDFLCFSAMDAQVDVTATGSAIFRRALPRAVQVFGGPTPTDRLEISSVLFPEADVLIRGQGEEALPHLLSIWDKLGQGAALEGSIIRLADETLVTDIDRVHFITPDQFILPSEETLAEADPERRDQVYFSRFCAWARCTYCGLAKGNYLSIPLAAALEYLRGRIAREANPKIRIFDDDALGNPAFWHALKEGMEAEGLLGKAAFSLDQTSLRSFQRDGGMDIDLMQLLKDLGVTHIHAGQDAAYDGANAAFGKYPGFVLGTRILLQLKAMGFKVDVNWIALPPSAALEDVARLLFHRKIYQLLDIPLLAMMRFVEPVQGTPMGNLFVETSPQIMRERLQQAQAGFPAPSLAIDRYVLWTRTGDVILPADPTVRALLSEHPLFRAKVDLTREEVSALLDGRFLSAFPRELRRKVMAAPPAERSDKLEQLARSRNAEAGRAVSQAIAQMIDGINRERRQAEQKRIGALGAEIAMDPMAYLLQFLPEAMLSAAAPGEPLSGAKAALVWRALNDSTPPAGISRSALVAARQNLRKILAEAKFDQVKARVEALNESSVQAALSPAGIESELTL